MGLLKRFLDIFKAKTNDALDNIEDAGQMLKQQIIDMGENISKSTIAVAQALASQKDLEKKLENAKKNSAEWEEKAKNALKTGREDLAEQALGKKLIADRNVQDLEPVCRNAKISAEKLKEQLEQMKIKFEEAKAREGTLTARSQFAKSQKEISKIMGGIGVVGFGDFEHYENKILKTEAEAEAYSELADEDNRLDKDIRELGRSEKIQADMERLKAEISGSQETQQV